ncbi:hypothetical protein T4B_5250 [Trichinella pseudospiralis]|uniref:Uncharacterized protein n=2 Tax=Trichinella pseudospiralis TaxID=6337 RepID=A0A0V1HXP0_TRIPS|nr:hypothetical protein T4D_5360 [Trichinella pseudospiralis]KRZ15470.1 hypothetical protein T4B_5250 [Trichinella pseudospiralis]
MSSENLNQQRQNVIISKSHRSEQCRRLQFEDAEINAIEREGTYL